MTDVTTNLIRDTFIANRPANVGVQEAEELFARWLADHDFRAEAEPSAPYGFDFEQVLEDYGIPADGLLAIAFASENVAAIADMLADVPLPEHSGLRKSLCETICDLDCAAKHLADIVVRHDDEMAKLFDEEGLLR